MIKTGENIGYSLGVGKSKRKSPQRGVEEGLKHNFCCTLRIPSR
jgi:hypothetical protein